LYSQDTLTLSRTKIKYHPTPNQYGLRGSIHLNCSEKDAIEDFYKYNLIFIFTDETFVYLATSEIENNTVVFILREEQYKSLFSKKIKGILFNLHKFDISEEQFFFK